MVKFKTVGRMPHQKNLVSIVTLLTFLFNALPLPAEEPPFDSEIPLTSSFASMDTNASTRRLQFIARANRLFAEKVTPLTSPNNVALGFGAIDRDSFKHAPLMRDITSIFKKRGLNSEYTFIKEFTAELIAKLTPSGNKKALDPRRRVRDMLRTRDIPFKKSRDTVTDILNAYSKFIQHDIPLTNAVAAAMMIHLLKYMEVYDEVMKGTPSRFIYGDWVGMRNDNETVQKMYQDNLENTTGDIKRLFDHYASTERLPSDDALWLRIQEQFEQSYHDMFNIDLADAYFNSIKRRFIPVDQVDFEYRREPPVVSSKEEKKRQVFTTFSNRDEDTKDLYAKIVHSIQFDGIGLDEADEKQAVKRIARKVSRHFRRNKVLRSVKIEQIDILKSILFRERSAFVVGRIRTDSKEIPFVPLMLTIHHKPAGGPMIAQVLTRHSEISRKFSYTRAPFKVRTDNHRGLMEFLRSLVQWKDEATLYRSVGYQNLAKSKQLEAIFGHIERTGEKFRFAIGSANPDYRGKVMIALELPTFGHVIKIMRDVFGSSKLVTHEDVRTKMKYTNNINGRGWILATTHFFNVRIPKNHFEPEVLKELLNEAGGSVTIQGEYIVLKEFYTQRHIIPLVIFVNGILDGSITLKSKKELSQPEKIRLITQIMLAYGRMYKILAKELNYTPLDWHLKNIGIIAAFTPNMRPVAYDHDEGQLITDLNFRSLEEAYSGPGVQGDDLSYVMASPDDLVVMPNDAFPEQHLDLLRWLPAEVLDEFKRVHGDLFDPAYFRNIQQQNLERRAELIDGFPNKMLARKKTELSIASGFGIEDKGMVSQSVLVITDSADKIFNALKTRAGRSVLQNPSRIVIAIEDAGLAKLWAERFYRLLRKYYAVKRDNIVGGGEELLHELRQVALLKQYGFYYIGPRDKLPVYLESAVHKNNFEIAEWAVWLGNALERELKAKQSLQIAA